MGSVVPPWDPEELTTANKPAYHNNKYDIITWNEILWREAHGPTMDPERS